MGGWPIGGRRTRYPDQAVAEEQRGRMLHIVGERAGHEEMLGRGQPRRSARLLIGFNSAPVRRSFTPWPRWCKKLADDAGDGVGHSLEGGFCHVGQAFQIRAVVGRCPGDARVTGPGKSPGQLLLGAIGGRRCAAPALAAMLWPISSRSCTGAG